MPFKTMFWISIMRRFLCPGMHSQYQIAYKYVSDLNAFPPQSLIFLCALCVATAPSALILYLCLWLCICRCIRLCLQNLGELEGAIEIILDVAFPVWALHKV